MDPSQPSSFSSNPYPSAEAGPSNYFSQQPPTSSASDPTATPAFQFHPQPEPGIIVSNAPPPDAALAPPPSAPDPLNRPLTGPGSRGGRGSRGKNRGRGRGGAGASDDFSLNRAARARHSVGSASQAGIGADTPSETSSFMPKSLKLNFTRAVPGSGGAGGARGRGSMGYTSFLGDYDRDIDSDEEEIEFEEQFILRVPAGKPSEEMRELVRENEKGKDKGKGKGVEDVWFKFKDSRRAVFHLGKQLYSAKLVDLPCILESQKTLDGKQMFKSADICQMLVVSDPISNEAQLANPDGNMGKLNIDDYIWPHGITPPLRHVRKRRFRKRISRRTIEVVEEEVERMLAQDSKSEKVTYDIIEDADPDASDSEFLTPAAKPINLPNINDGGSEYGGTGAGSEFGGESENNFGATPRADGGAGDGGGGGDGFDLAAELTKGLKDLEDSDSDEDADKEKDLDDDDDEDDEPEHSEDEDEEADSEDEEAVELAQRQKLLNEEIRDLEAAVAKKKAEIAKSGNVIIKKRFEDALRKLQADLDTKISARVSNVQAKEKRKREDEEEKERESSFREAAAQAAQAQAQAVLAAAMAQDTSAATGVGSAPAGVAPALNGLASASIRRPGQPGQPSTAVTNPTSTSHLPTLPPLPSLASSTTTTPYLPPPPNSAAATLQHRAGVAGHSATRQPSSLSASHLPPPPLPDLATASGTADFESLMNAGLDDDDEESEEGEEEEDDLFGDGDGEDEDEGDMEEMDVS